MCVRRRCRCWGHHWRRRCNHNALRYRHCGHRHGRHGGQLHLLFLCDWHWLWHFLARVHTVIGHVRDVCFLCACRPTFRIIALRSSAQIFIFFFTRFLLFCLYCLYFSRFFFLFTFCVWTANSLQYSQLARALQVATLQHQREYRLKLCDLYFPC